MANLNALIAQGYQFQPPVNPFVQYGQMQQLEQGQQTNELNRMKMQEYQRGMEETNALRRLDPASPTYLQDVTRISPEKGFAFAKAQQEAATARLNQEKLKGEVTAQPVKLSADKAKLLDDKLKLSRQFLDTLDPSDPNARARYLAWHEANHADPDIGPALLARGVTADQARMQIDAAIAKGPADFAKLLNQSKLGTEKFMEMNKPTTQVVDQSGQRQVLQIPGLGGTPTSVGTYADVPLPAAVEAQKSRIARAGASNISLSTEKKYGENLAGKIADRDDAKLGAAEKAPQLAESANRIIDLVKQGDLFTGPIADIKLNVARGLNVLGADNNAKIANTELLIAATGQSTLDAIKSAGLGTGQGFTDKDLNFLRGIAGGKIDFKPETLTELARLQHLAATRSVQAWNTRFKDIPKSSIEGMGLRTAPDVPPLSPNAIFATNPKTGARIQSLDGGANWTPVGGK